MKGSRVLVVQTGFLGDAILSTALVGSLAKRSTVEHVGLVVRDSYADLFDRHPAIDELFRLDKGSARGTRLSVEAIRSSAYDVALIPHRSLSSAKLVWKSRIPVRVGFRTADAPFLYTDRVEYRTGRHEVERNDDLLRGWSGEGTPPGELRTSIPVSHQPGLRLPEGPSVAIAYGSVWETKQWGKDNYAALCRKLTAAGIRPLLVGSPAERSTGEWIAWEAGLSPENFLAGTLTLPELANLLGAVSATVSNDSGGMHLSEAVGTPVVALFGPTIREFGFAPILNSSRIVEVDSLSCRPCGIHGGRFCPLGHHRCMTGISVESAFRSTVELVEQTQATIRE